MPPGAAARRGLRSAACSPCCPRRVAAALWRHPRGRVGLPLLARGVSPVDRLAGPPAATALLEPWRPLPDARDRPTPRGRGRPDERVRSACQPRQPVASLEMKPGLEADVQPLALPSDAVGIDEATLFRLAQSLGIEQVQRLASSLRCGGAPSDHSSSSLLLRHVASVLPLLPPLSTDLARGTTLTGEVTALQPMCILPNATGEELCTGPAAAAVAGSSDAGGQGGSHVAMPGFDDRQLQHDLGSLALDQLNGNHSCERGNTGVWWSPALAQQPPASALGLDVTAEQARQLEFGEALPLLPQQPVALFSGPASGGALAHPLHDGTAARPRPALHRDQQQPDAFDYRPKGLEAEASAASSGRAQWLQNSEASGNGMAVQLREAVLRAGATGRPLSETLSDGQVWDLFSLGLVPSPFRQELSPSHIQTAVQRCLCLGPLQPPPPPPLPPPEDAAWMPAKAARARARRRVVGARPPAWGGSGGSTNSGGDPLDQAAKRLLEDGEALGLALPPDVMELWPPFPTLPVAGGGPMTGWRPDGNEGHMHMAPLHSLPTRDHPPAAAAAAAPAAYLPQSVVFDSPALLGSYTASTLTEESTVALAGHVPSSPGMLAASGHTEGPSLGGWPDFRNHIERGFPEQTRLPAAAARSQLHYPPGQQQPSRSPTPDKLPHRRLRELFREAQGSLLPARQDAGSPSPATETGSPPRPSLKLCRSSSSPAGRLLPKEPQAGAGTGASGGGSSGGGGHQSESSPVSRRKRKGRAVEHSPCRSENERELHSSGSEHVEATSSAATWPEGGLLPASTDCKREGNGSGLSGSRKARWGQTMEPQAVAARARRRQVNDRIRKLQGLLPSKGRTDVVRMLEEVLEYVKFLQGQVKILSSDPSARQPPSTDLGTSADKDSKPAPKASLQSRGLCLLPMSTTGMLRLESASD
eukprot:SM000249S08233  [mRNA]  locus=s249:87071:91048:+ [translate_table: standard]